MQCEDTKYSEHYIHHCRLGVPDKNTTQVYNQITLYKENEVVPHLLKDKKYALLHINEELV